MPGHASGPVFSGKLFPFLRRTGGWLTWFLVLVGWASTFAALLAILEER